MYGYSRVQFKTTSQPKVDSNSSLFTSSFHPGTVNQQKVVSGQSTYASSQLNPTTQCGVINGDSSAVSTHDRVYPQENSVPIVNLSDEHCDCRELAKF